jgi:hypothetical protein
MASKVNKEQDPPEIDENICWGKNYPKLYNEIIRNVKKSGIISKLLSTEKSEESRDNLYLV